MNGNEIEKERIRRNAYWDRIAKVLEHWLISSPEELDTALRFRGLTPDASFTVIKLCDEGARQLGGIE